MLGNPSSVLTSRDALAEYTGRIERYMLKAVKEAKTHTSWTDSDEEYEQSVKRFVHALLEDAGLEGQVEDGIALADRSRPRVRCLEVPPAEPDFDGARRTTGSP